jgi:hypothetical protein
MVVITGNRGDHGLRISGIGLLALGNLGVGEYLRHLTGHATVNQRTIFEAKLTRQNHPVANFQRRGTKTATG